LCAPRSSFTWLIFLAALALLPAWAGAQGGPPLLTDDPGTPGNRHWEINLGFTVEHTRAETLLEIPRVDFNYGLGNHIQLKFEIPWLRLDEHAEVKNGLGNSVFGVKWRMLGEKKRGISISAYPQVEFNNPTSSANRGLVEKGTQFLLPVEMSRRVGPIEVDGEIGYRFIQNRPDEWFYGLALGHQFTQRLEVIGELHGTSVRNFTADQLVYNIGGRFKVAHKLVLLFAGGRSIRDLPDEHRRVFASVGLRLNF